MENQLNKEQLLDWYTEAILDGSSFQNMHQFASHCKISEAAIYPFFTHLDKIEAYFFELLIEKTLETLQASEEYVDYISKDKLLSFYYTFFGNLTANRSFALHLMGKKELKTLKILAPLRKHFQAYVATLGLEPLQSKQQELQKLQSKAVEETAWLQLLLTLKFWKEDTSPSFEKTDVFIEKSINTSFDLVDTSALKSVLDLGKFLLKEIKK